MTVFTVKGGSGLNDSKRLEIIKVIKNQTHCSKRFFIKKLDEFVVPFINRESLIFCAEFAQINESIFLFI